MALFLILEPHDDIRRLYAAVVRGLGHDAAFLDSSSGAAPDVVLVEPAHLESFQAAVSLRRERPGLPIVCASIHEATDDEVQRVQAGAYLLKPFSLVELTAALQLALSQGDLLSG